MLAYIERQAGTLRSWRGSFHRLAAVAVPTLIITGTDDRIIPPENAELLAQGLRDSRVVKIQGGGHGVLYQQPKRLAELISAFLAPD
ncbi:alpha/beta fold hydrolase [Thioalkalivibrio paradoxus]|uniref:Peptidase S33 tripeptidyl aminopeptidase-like C-terminal domain-containing protein n=1 Tax=Thioalkalivibrio paradoxus ARh 1 TaxID=713585 RepID=W0DRS8_9GAMM|nr:alpha/beta fold hydrolase [Thioalkalivibrio paradoxus]AHE99977.1 hypothetical protein THITH_05530 [Thioalkalivibrio paradoxus ARh 1]